MRTSGSSSHRASWRRLGTKARPPAGAHGRQSPRRAAGMARLELRASRQKVIVPRGLAAPASPRRLGAPLRLLEKARHRRQVLSRGRPQANGWPVQGSRRTPSWRQPCAVVSLSPRRARVAPGRRKVFSSSFDGGFWQVCRDVWLVPQLVVIRARGTQLERKCASSNRLEGPPSSDASQTVIGVIEISVQS